MYKNRSYTHSRLVLVAVGTCSSAGTEVLPSTEPGAKHLSSGKKGFLTATSKAVSGWYNVLTAGMKELIHFPSIIFFFVEPI